MLNPNDGPNALCQVETSLLAIDSSITLPYWNFILDSNLDDWTTAMVHGLISITTQLTLTNVNRF